ncbi:UNVERIFIED_CONTAM: hypothetical protein Scaly_2479200 [Sesamum calycinum]|uniref:Uncharacterized protein n=1 Tax=Sesamum calycinum TaxID=2727403 RepID=A0AAW2LSM7_9LAMI
MLTLDWLITDLLQISPWDANAAPTFASNPSFLPLPWLSSSRPPPPQVPRQPTSGLVHPLLRHLPNRPQTPVPPPATFPRSPSDRFLLKTAAAPDLGADFPESTQSSSSTAGSTPRLIVPLMTSSSRFTSLAPFSSLTRVGAGDFEAVRSIVKRQRSVVSELPAREAESLYRVAAQFPDVMGLLLEAGLRVDVGRELYDDGRMAAKGWTELHVAAAFDRQEEVERLSKEREAVDCRDKEGRTPLHLAASKGHLGSTKVLVSAGASVDARSKDGRTALYRAAANGDRPIVEMLLGAGRTPLLVMWIIVVQPLMSPGIRARYVIPPFISS